MNTTQILRIMQSTQDNTMASNLRPPSQQVQNARHRYPMDVLTTIEVNHPAPNLSRSVLLMQTESPIMQDLIRAIARASR